MALVDGTLGACRLDALFFKYVGFCLFTVYFPTGQNPLFDWFAAHSTDIYQLLFYYFYPNVEAYAGLSGVLHGLYVACALYYLKFKSERQFSTLVLGLVLAKIIWENTFGSLQTAELIGSPVLVEAHLLGVIGGILAVMTYFIYRYVKTLLTPQRKF